MSPDATKLYSRNYTINDNESYFRIVSVHQIVSFHVGMVNDKLENLDGKYRGLIDAF